MDKIKKYDITGDVTEYGFGYDESKNGEWLKVEDVEERLLEIKSRVCDCDPTGNVSKCHGCRIIEELFGNIENTDN